MTEHAAELAQRYFLFQKTCVAWMSVAFPPYPPPPLTKTTNIEKN